MVWDILSLIEQLLPPDSDAGDQAAAGGPLGEFRRCSSGCGEGAGPGPAAQAFS